MLLLSDLLTRGAGLAGPPGCTGLPRPSTRADWECHWRKSFRPTCATLEPAALAHVLMAGMTFTELPFASTTSVSLVRRMHHGGDFVIDPLPNLMFTRDSSFWIGPRVAIPSLSLPARVRETSLTDLIYAHHPRFLGVRRAYESRSAPVEGGDVLLLAPGVIAVGVGERTTPAGAEALARSLFDDELAHTVLAVPIAQERAQMHLDTVCTMVDVDAVVMYPNIVDSLSAFTIRRSAGGVRIERRGTVRARPPPTRWASTGCASSTPAWTRSPPSASSGTTATTPWRWRPGVVVAYERNSQTNARLADSGIEVLTIAASELGTGAAARCMSCPAARDP